MSQITKEDFENMTFGEIIDLIRDGVDALEEIYLVISDQFIESIEDPFAEDRYMENHRQ